MENEPKQQPKPSDDVQLEIETVTPDTEKNAVENDAELKKDPKETETVAPEATGESETEEDIAPEEENNESDEHKAQPGAPDIETVSP